MTAGSPALVRDAPAEGADPSASVDWNEAWRIARGRSPRRAGRDTWDRRAPSFARSESSTGYVERVLEIMNLEPGLTVLDIGSGAGTLTLPLARRVRSVTALDFSPRMLDLLRQGCAREGLANVAPVLGSWEDDWAELGIAACDVALASRSLTVEDLRSALLKLDRFARRRAFVTAPVGGGPADRRLIEAVGRSYLPGPDYTYPYNMLRQLGLNPTLAFISHSYAHEYASVEDAFDRVLWMLPDPSPRELERLRDFLARALVPCPKGFEFAWPHPVTWAVISWAPRGGP